jgi:hypothetical protein
VELLVRVDWKDREGQPWSDAALLHDVEKTFEAIRKDEGKVVGVRKLEDRCATSQS